MGVRIWRLFKAFTKRGVSDREGVEWERRGTSKLAQQVQCYSCDNSRPAFLLSEPVHEDVRH